MHYALWIMNWKKPSAAKWDEGFRGTTQIQKGRSPFLGILNAEIRSVFTEKLRGSTCPWYESSHRPLSLWGITYTVSPVNAVMQYYYNAVFTKSQWVDSFLEIFFKNPWQIGFDGV